MNVTAIIIAALVVGAVGIILGFFLGISGEKFKVEVDPREEAILEVLPGNNCGGCHCKGRGTGRTVSCWWRPCCGKGQRDYGCKG